MRYLPKKSKISYFIKSTYWFAVGFILMGALISSALLFYFQFEYKEKAIPGVFIDNIYVGEKTRNEIEEIFNRRNEKIGRNVFVLSTDGESATISAKTLNIGYNVKLIADQTLSLGKTKNLPSDVYMILSSYINGMFLKSSYTFDGDALKKQIDPLQKNIYREAVDAQFKISNNRVVAFRQSSNGRTINFEELNSKVASSIPELINKDPGITGIAVPIEILEPQLTTEEVNNFGIEEIIGVGKSTFFHSIPGRIHNVTLAASKMNGVLVAPGEEFSFNEILGDVSKFTGYQQAYIIQNGRTVLGDGGGVCQVSTTLFRAILNAGLPVTERHAHAYRVGYYEQDQPPGFDATTFVPTVDLKFKNDTGNHILIQTVTDTDNLALTFTLYGKSDGRKVEISNPVISNVSSPPPDLYQDDPTLPAGVVKQVDFAAPGARSVFTRSVTRDGKIILNDTFVSVYRPWRAIFLKGTKM